VRYEILHKTEYEYDNAVSVSHHLVRLTPRELPHQRPLQHHLETVPQPALTHSRLDYFGNPLTSITLEGPHRQLSVTARSVVEVVPPVRPASDQTGAWEGVRDLCCGAASAAAQDACEFVFPSSRVSRRPEFADYASSSFPAGQPVLAGGVDLMHRVHHDFVFDPKATTVATPPEQFFQQRRGVCQDFAHFQIACLRSLGLAARYVSGYVETQPPPGQPKLVGADASHAWLQLWCGQAGWLDLDPTNDLLPAERHITLAWGRDFTDVSPLSGVLLGSGRHRLTVAVDVTPLQFCR
jgi:transglutaminase-like putative cysteine protease